MSSSTPYSHDAKAKALLASLSGPHFSSLSEKQKFSKICQALFDDIDALEKTSFALPRVLELIAAINATEPLPRPFRFHNFELWLNALSGIDESKNLEIRAKLAGRSLPREEYQTFFPIGMGKQAWGTHIVTAHSSPDLDTAVASFWGWLDAFAARVGTGLHHWNVPGARLSDQDARVFYTHFGKQLFSTLAKGKEHLSLQAIDLFTPHSLVALTHEHAISQIDPAAFEKGVIFVDESGYYLGDWRVSDVEEVRQILGLTHGALREFENRLRSELISLFAKPDLTQAMAHSTIEAILDSPLATQELLDDASETQRKGFENYLKQLLELPQGWRSTWREWADKLQTKGLSAFNQFIKELEALIHQTHLFDASEHLIEDRPHLMNAINQCVQGLDLAVHALKEHHEKLGFAMEIKKLVLGLSSEHVVSKASVEELQSLMGHHTYLTVVIPEANGKLIPLGAIYAETLNRKSLGTVSLRDFSNREEVKLSHYFEIISVIDHHKSDLRSVSAPVAILADAQSCNTLVAEAQMMLNDRYSLGGQTAQSIEEQLETLRVKKVLSPSEKTKLQRLLTREKAVQRTSDSPFFVSPSREALEYLFYLYAIIDDTDLLAKVSVRDLVCITQLINRLHALEKGGEFEILTLDDLPKDKEFIKKARERILKDASMYQLYSQAYAFKEESLREQMLAASAHLPSTLFSDTKIQNACARVGQIKLTSALVSFFDEHQSPLAARWLSDSMEVFHTSPQIQLHMQMISTIAGAKDVYENKPTGTGHLDQLWIWSSMDEGSQEALIAFLRGFQFARELEGTPLYLDVQGPEAKAMQNLFHHHFKPCEAKKIATTDVKEGAWAILQFEASRLNSRKAAITPYLPSHN